MDERFKLHRLYSTRFATIVCLVLIGFWFNYEYFTNQLIRWDLFIILMATALSKIGAMIYYRKTN
ncbi:hypothetical protein ACFLSX_01000 [Calditrichota bacterium]